MQTKFQYNVKSSTKLLITKERTSTYRMQFSIGSETTPVKQDNHRQFGNVRSFLIN